MHKLFFGKSIEDADKNKRPENGWYIGGFIFMLILGVPVYYWLFFTDYTFSGFKWWLMALSYPFIVLWHTPLGMWLDGWTEEEKQRLQ
jgi:hypothetical protein